MLVNFLMSPPAFAARGRRTAKAAFAVRGFLLRSVSLNRFPLYG
jgi:hypothetical protein